MKVLFTGGGSGGHILPNIALINELRSKKKHIELFYIGEHKSMEEELVTPLDVTFYSISAGKLRRYFSFKNFFDPLKICIGTIQSLFLIAKIRPDVIFAKGGYVSFPVVLAGWILRKNIIIHESDVTPGLTTKLCSKFARTICVSWQKTLSYFPKKKTVLTGIPIRRELAHGKKEHARSAIGWHNNALPTLLIAGGSLGALALNEFVFTNLDNLLEEDNILHMVGKGNSQTTSLSKTSKGNYYQFEFAGKEWKDLLALADMVLSRSGTTALAEFEYLGKPCILVPLPTVGSRGDQYDNAEEYKKKHPHACAIIDQKDLTIESLLPSIKKLQKEKEQGSNAAEKIITLFV